MSPSTRNFGRSPAEICKSEAFRSIISSSRVRNATVDGAGAVMGQILRRKAEPVAAKHKPRHGREERA
jgi:hypothetical protein